MGQNAKAKQVDATIVFIIGPFVSVASLGPSTTIKKATYLGEQRRYDIVARSL